MGQRPRASGRRQPHSVERDCNVRLIFVFLLNTLETAHAQPAASADPVFAAVVAAAATVGVAIAGAIGGAITAYFQHRTDMAKLETETLISLLKLGPGERMEYTKRLIQSGKL